jgi:hypothetical protein
MSTLLLCYYCIGWACVAHDCRGYGYGDELTLGDMVLLILLWPIAIVMLSMELVPASIEFVVWRKQ